MPRARALLLPLLLVACRPSPAARTGPAAPAPAASEPRSTDGLAPAEQRRRERGLAALDAGRFDLARSEFAGLLAAEPDNMATRALFIAATRALLDARTRATEAFASAVPIVLPAPPWQHTVAREIGLATTPAPRLVEVTSTPDRTGDELAWFDRHGLRLPEYQVPNPMRGDPGDLPPALPPAWREHLLVQAIAHPDHTVLVYGPSYSSGRFVAVLDAHGERLGFLDFDAYRLAPGAVDRPQGVVWAEAQGGVLYVSHASERAAGGPTAYLTAVDLATGALRWRSDPGVAGAADFVLHGGHIVTGHGAVDVPARLLVLDRRSGTIVATTPLTSAPEYLFVQRGALRVRTGDSDLEFALR